MFLRILHSYELRTTFKYIFEGIPTLQFGSDLLQICCHIVQIGLIWGCQIWRCQVVAKGPYRSSQIAPNVAKMRPNQKGRFTSELA